MNEGVAWKPQYILVIEKEKTNMALKKEIALIQVKLYLQEEGAREEKG